MAPERGWHRNCGRTVPDTLARNPGADCSRLVLGIRSDDRNAGKLEKAREALALS